MKYTIGIDLGGTKINALLIDNKSRVIRKIKQPTGLKKNKKTIIKKILEIITFLSSGISKKSIKGIGIGVPGILNKEKTKILTLPNLPGWENTKLKRILEKKTKLKVLMENDTNCTALAEFYLKHEKINNLICITLGTGVGGGIIINKKIYNGNGKSAEFGHTTIEPKGIKCSCGNHGCLEEYVSARGIIRIAKKLGLKEKNTIKLQELAEKGNKKAQKTFKIAGQYLGIGLSNIIKAFDPDIIVIGGGISNTGDLLLNPAKQEAKKRLCFKPCKIKTTKLKEDAGAIGATHLFKLT